MWPSVTLSSRRGSVTSETLDSGSTFLVSTSFSCSIQARIPDSSPASGPSSSSGTLRRASRAMRATVSLSSDIQATPTHPPHSYGEVAPSYGDGGVIGNHLALMTPPPRQTGHLPIRRGTSPYEWGGVKKSASRRRGAPPPLRSRYAAPVVGRGVR